MLKNKWLSKKILGKQILDLFLLYNIWDSGLEYIILILATQKEEQE